MEISNTCYIKFKHGDFSNLKETILKDLSNESFAILLGKHEHISGSDFINIYETIFTPKEYYKSRNLSFLELNKKFIHKILSDVVNRYDVDTIIDVHTHPFCKTNVTFSSTDNHDEIKFASFLNENFDNINYASIVFSQTDYSARIWKYNQKNKPYSNKAIIKTQTTKECPTNTNQPFNEDKIFHKTDSIFNRSVLALGLDVMRAIVSNQSISLVGVGGLGSVIAEHLVHMGFSKINLFDNDILEISNLNRFVGGYYEDAINQKPKVEVVKKHLLNINPNIEVNIYNVDISNPSAEALLAFSDWIIISTDNHYSRFKTQQIAFKYFIPFIAAGVNISVEDNKITDYSGEVITVRMGDSFCLDCLKRINYINIAHERHPERNIRDSLEKNGYVTGKNVKEPAVKTLNTTLATMSINALINQFTDKKQPPIIVYENNIQECIYEDKESLESKKNNCHTCNI